MITPKNEQGVVVLFQELSKKIGLELVHVQTRFPDGVVRDNQGKEYRVEFEYQSGNFLAHKHDPNGCDVVICWEHTTDLPVPVISLSQILKDDEILREVQAKRFSESLGFWSGVVLIAVVDYLLVHSKEMGSLYLISVITAIVYHFYLYIVAWNRRK